MSFSRDWLCRIWELVCFAQTGFVVSLTARLISLFNVWCPAFILMSSTSYLLITISFFTVTALSVERLLALQLHLRFQELVTNARVLLILTIIWLTGVLTQILRITATVLVFGCFTVSWVIVLTGVNVYCYRKIYQIVQRYQTQITLPNVNRRKPSSLCCTFTDFSRCVTFQRF